jgi:rSAM/selenodomain-associated transferase 2
VLVSIVIPVRGDLDALDALLADLPPLPEVQVIVSATGPVGDASRRLRASRPDVVWVDGPPGRGPQQNRGAARATGRWLWFVHADSRLPGVWLQAFRDLDPRDGVVGGSFRLALASEAWQARLWERGVAARVALFGLPYGDQGLFVRRETFQDLGGFAEIPLMEDVDLVRRLKRRGALCHLRLRLATSARRWERGGWVRRSARNLALLALYYCGVPPARLARLYDREL